MARKPRKAKDIEQEHVEATAPEAGNGVGHNKLTEEQERALFFHHMGRVKHQKEKVASETGTLRAMLKQAKADGFSKKDIDYALSLEDDPEEETIERRRREQMIALWMQHPIGTQPDMFDLSPDRTPSVDRAFEMGKIAGMKGESMHPPHAENTEQGQKWMDGWHAGQLSIFAIQKMKDAEAFDDDAEGEDGNGAGDPLPLGDQPATHAAAN